MSTGKHPPVQDSANEDAIAVSPIEDDVLLVLDAAVSWPNPIAGAADSRSFDNSIEASFQAIEIPLGLLRAPGVHGVIGNINQVEPSELRELVRGQSSHLARHQSAPLDTNSKLAENVPLGNSALLACQNCGAQCIELGPIFLFNLFKRAQARAQHFACVRVVAALDSAVDKFVQLRRKIDIARRHD
jgi:hypothetical protein